MNYNTPTPTPGAIVVPFGWVAEWSAEYARYFYVNINTKESTWVLPVSPPPAQQSQQLPQRKPVPTPSQQPQPQIVAPVAQRAFVESYPTPPPQISTGYFSPAPGSQQQQLSQIAQQNPRHQFPQAIQQTQQRFTSAPQAQMQVSELPAPHQQQQPSTVLQLQYPQAQQYAFQQTAYIPPVQPITPVATPGSQRAPQYNHSPSFASPIGIYIPTAQYPQPQQALSPPATPNSANPQQIASAPSNAYISSVSSQGNAAHQIHQQGGYQNQLQGPPRYQAQQPQYQAQQPQYQTQQPQYQAQPHQSQPQTNHRTSMIGGSLMGGSMMNKMSSKFTHLQKGFGGTPSTAHAQSNGKAPADWKKWAKRGAIGVAGIGALAIGVDAAGDMFSGAEALGGGGDFSGGGDFACGGDVSGGGDFTGGGYEGGDAAAVMDAQTAVDANAAQLGMEQMGQENAMMLADPAGTTYHFVDAQNTQSAMGLI